VGVYVKQADECAAVSLSQLLHDVSPFFFPIDKFYHKK
jgi:hypothetical protein